MGDYTIIQGLHNCSSFGCSTAGLALTCLLIFEKNMWISYSRPYPIFSLNKNRPSIAGFLSTTQGTILLIANSIGLIKSVSKLSPIYRTELPLNTLNKLSFVAHYNDDYSSFSDYNKLLNHKLISHKKDMT